MLFDAILTLLFSYVWKKLFVVVILFCCLDCVVVLIMAGFISSLIWLYLFFWVKWIGRNFFVNTNFFGGFEFGRDFSQTIGWAGGRNIMCKPTFLGPFFLIDIGLSTKVATLEARVLKKFLSLHNEYILHKKNFWAFCIFDISFLKNIWFI